MQRLCLSVLLLASLVEKVKAQDRQPHLFEITQLSDSATLQRCRNDLLEIDENEDMQLDRSEYAAFLQLQSGNQMSGESEDVPLRLEAIYHSTACWCDVVDPTDEECCLDGKDHIPLDTDGSTLIEPYLQFFCSNVQNGLEAEGLSQPLVTPMPSASPTSLEPTSVPTSEPSDLPSDLPTIEPTAEPSIEPSDEPTTTPSTLPSVVPTSSPTTLPPTLAPTVLPIEPTSKAPTPSPTSGTPTTSPTTVAPTQGPTTVAPTIVLTQSPSDPPTPVTLCVDFQYTIKNSAGHDAASLLEATDNTILDDLLEGTASIMTDILNGTYPPPQRRQLLMEQQQQEQHVMQERRRLAFYSSDYPATINSVTDNDECAGSEENPDVACATVASTVCAVLEQGDNPLGVRATMIAGLQYAVESGDFPEPEELPPTQAPTTAPLPTLCVDFQYVVRNQIGLDADAIFNEEGNNVLQGLELSTRNITIEILNGTYPPARRLLDTEHVNTNYILRTSSEITPLAVDTFSASGPRERRQLRQRSLNGERRLMYYSDDYPVSINSVTDNPLCAGQDQNPDIKCAIISSTVCVVLEEGDDPSEVRALMIAGLREAVQTGEFLRRIPPDDLTTRL